MESVDHVEGSMLKQKRRRYSESDRRLRLDAASYYDIEYCHELQKIKCDFCNTCDRSWCERKSVPEDNRIMFATKGCASVPETYLVHRNNGNNASIKTKWRKVACPGCCGCKRCEDRLKSYVLQLRPAPDVEHLQIDDGGGHGHVSCDDDYRTNTNMGSGDQDNYEGTGFFPSYDGSPAYGDSPAYDDSSSQFQDHDEQEEVVEVVAVPVQQRGIQRGIPTM
jgi:hypothetical protein